MNLSSISLKISSKLLKPVPYSQIFFDNPCFEFQESMYYTCVQLHTWITCGNILLVNQEIDIFLRRITELQSCFGWKRPLKSLSPTFKINGFINNNFRNCFLCSCTLKAQLILTLYRKRSFSHLKFQFTRAIESISPLWSSTDAQISLIFMLHS